MEFDAVGGTHPPNYQERMSGPGSTMGSHHHAPQVLMPPTFPDMIKYAHRPLDEGESVKEGCEELDG